jgi:HAD superfamily hydrolase (TIGR01509 family)
VQAAFAEVVGRSREQVSQALAARFGLEDLARWRGQDPQDRLTGSGTEGAARPGQEEADPREPWQALARLRLQIYEQMLSDPDLLRANQWPHAVELLRAAARSGCSTALASMSTHDQVGRVLEAVGLQDQFDVVLSREEVECPKPDPEIYRLAAELLDTPPRQCLVIEDSPAGVQAAVAAGMHCVAVATPFTRAGLQRQTWLAQEWVVEDPAALPQVVERLIRDQAA